MENIIIILATISILIPLTFANHCKFSAVFAFGDSTADTGNNNRLSTVARADHPPYGQNFYNAMATGRFSNGRLIPDLVVSTLGLKKSLPPFAVASTLTPAELSTGVGFASAGSGLDNGTALLGGSDTVEQQEAEFRSYVSMLRSFVGHKQAHKVIKNAVFMSSVGTDDMIMNYYIPLSIRRVQYPDIANYHRFLIDRLESFIKTLYGMGGRKFAIAGYPPLGCLPVQMTRDYFNLADGHLGKRFCNASQNDNAVAYNAKLQDSIISLRSSLKGVKIAYFDIYTLLMDMIQNPKKYGFSEVMLGCCGTGLFELGVLCISPEPVCSDPSKYLFWDSVHPTEAANKIMTEVLVARVLPQLAD